MCSVNTGAKIPQYRSSDINKKCIENVHIAVFFDGTNNNAVQQIIFNSYKEKKGKHTSINSESTAQFDKALKLKDEIEKLETELAMLSSGSNTCYYNAEEISRIKGEIQEKKTQLSEINIHPILDRLYMSSISDKGYSNVSILYSLLKTQTNTDKDIYYDLYVEGSGATDISASYESNVNGLGFGLGKTGVTALVSKSVKNITYFLKSNKEKFDENTKYHFYVFGFSRGSTCARLFVELTTRDEKNRLKRENEFSQDTSHVSHLMVDGRLPFMEKMYFNGSPIIKRENVIVEFLGIYDTVASIGFLKQKDGWTNILSLPYRGFAWNNYHGNFHYMNPHDYGLYSPHNKRVNYTCHICAGDEFRENFALVNLGKSVPPNSIEVIIPGCHSDVGGGYVRGVEMDVVLYKFVPRKFEHFLKHNKLFEIMGTAYLKSKERAKMFLDNPSIFEGEKAELNPNTLAKLGWIGKEWLDNHSKQDPEKSYDSEVCTKRVANWINEIKFKRYVMQGYSNIPLKMMINCVKKQGHQFLFEEDDVYYTIPDQLADLSKRMIDAIEGVSGRRVWLLPGNCYSSNQYRKLRLNYLHFTSTCELGHFRTPVTKENQTKDKNIDSITGGEGSFVEFQGGNFGNNCNYDNYANICRIMYNGDKELSGDHKQNVHYMYELSQMGLKEIGC